MLPTGRDTNSNDAKSLRCRIFVGNLATDQTTKREVEEIFSKYGVIVSSSLHNNYGFIQFESEKGADEAVLGMHGTNLFGKRIDVNLAGVRRKPQSKDKHEGTPRKEEVVPDHMMKAGAAGKRPPPRNRSRSPHRPPPGGEGGYQRSLSPMSRYEELYRRDDAYRRDRYRDPYDNPPPARDPYHFDRRDALPPARYDAPYDDGYRRPPPPRPIRPTIDCEILSLFKEESRYAEDVEARLRSIGLVCNIGYPREDIPIAEIIDRVARTGTLYAVVVTEQNAQHRSCTLNILNGPRQEHRNMPLEDALSFVARNFDAYLRGLREPPPPHRGGVPPHAYPPRDDYARGPPPPMHHAPPASSGGGYAPLKAADGEKKLSNEELNDMIEKLKREKEEREGGAKNDAGLPPMQNPPENKIPPPANGSGGGAYYDNYSSNYR